jgi:hypothetical protein
MGCLGVFFHVILPSVICGDTELVECLVTCLCPEIVEPSPNAPDPTPAHNAVPPIASTRHRLSTDLGINLVGYSFTDRALGQCKVVGPSTYTDEDNIVWNTLEFTSTTYPIDLQFSKVSEVRAWIAKDKNHRASAPVTTPVQPAPQRLTEGPNPDSALFAGSHFSQCRRSPSIVTIYAAIGVLHPPNAFAVITLTTAEPMPPYSPSPRPTFPRIASYVWERADPDELIRLL